MQSMIQHHTWYAANGVTYVFSIATILKTVVTSQLEMLWCQLNGHWGLFSALFLVSDSLPGVTQALLVSTGMALTQNMM